MADYHLSLWEELERLTREHTLCYSISGQGFVDEETRSTNEATAMEKAAGDVAVELEEIPSHSSNNQVSPYATKVSQGKPGAINNILAIFYLFVYLFFLSLLLVFCRTVKVGSIEWRNKDFELFSCSNSATFFLPCVHHNSMVFS